MFNAALGERAALPPSPLLLNHVVALCIRHTYSKARIKLYIEHTVDRVVGSIKNARGYLGPIGAISGFGAKNHFGDVVFVGLQNG